MRHISILFSVAAVLTSLLAAPALAGAITNGVPDGEAHPYVGIIFNDEAFCSGTLLSPTVFLTAGRCTVLIAEGGSPVYVSFDADPFGEEATFYEVAEVYAPEPRVSRLMDCRDASPAHGSIARLGR